MSNIEDLMGYMAHKVDQWIKEHKPMKNEPAYYWVKYKGKWVIAQYMHQGIIYEWGLIGVDRTFRSSDFEEYNKTPIECKNTFTEEVRP